MRILVVDDESLARGRLKRLLAQLNNFDRIFEAENGLQARTLLQQQTIDVVFLDIQMPGESGLALGEYLLTLSPRPAVILVTAHPEHALDAYAILPVDYIVKPVSADRIAQALHRVSISRQAIMQKSQGAKISYQLAGVMRQVAFEQILYFIADEKYVRMIFEGGEALLEQSLAQLEQQFPQSLQRIHRHTLVNWQHFDSLSMQLDGKAKMTLRGCAQMLDVSRREASRLKQLINTKIK